MSTETLTSLAILKVNIDRGGDYLNYLRPFILQVLVDHKPAPVTTSVVKDLIRKKFGLEIPDRTVQVVLQRIARHRHLKREAGVYHITGSLPDPGIAAKQSEARRHIKAIVTDLIVFSADSLRPFSNTESAETAICAFLAEFGISCLRAYLRGTVIPNIEGQNDAAIVLVSKYIIHLQETDPERFESLMVVVQGHMLANALLCPDLQHASATYKNVTFCLDTPLLVRHIGLEGRPKEDAVKELLCLLRHLKGRVCVFSHSYNELNRVIHGAAAHLEAADGRGAIVMEARRRGTTKSDLLLLAEQVDDHLALAEIKVKDTPRYIKRFQIDEAMFEQILGDEVSYDNPRARQDDINSVRSIYVLRRRLSPYSVEKSRAILITSNSGFARAAWIYGRQYEQSREVSSVITDFSLANIAWLKTPMGAPSLPTTEVLAFSYAALQPSQELLTAYLEEIEKLEQRGNITANDHQLLRSRPQAYDELMDLTLGDKAALTPETVTETLERVVSSIRKEESIKVTEEQRKHQETQEALNSQRARNRKITMNLYRRCRSRARALAWVLSVGVGVLLAIGLLAGLGLLSGLGLRPTAPFSWILAGGSALFALVTLVNLVIGSTVIDIHAWVQRRCLIWLLKREAKTTGVDLEEFIARSSSAP